MSRKLRPKLRCGQVWVTRRTAHTSTPSRRILLLLPSAEGDVVIYSTGSDAAPRRCLRASFRVWIHRHNAVATRTRRPRRMVLR